jgi:4-aminobutyrate aminotransferase-like enzyme/Ser/Thr protein kinase RdoA (MazF antagonist)
MSLLHHAPRFGLADAVRLARDCYGLESTAHPLPSERDQNFALETTGGRFVLKIANPEESRQQIEAEVSAMALVSAAGAGCPQVVRARDGREVVEHDGHLVRLLTWIPGVTLASVRHHSSALLEDLGRELGRIDRALAGFDHAATRRSLAWDMATALDTIRRYLPDVAEPQWRGALEREVHAIERAHRPELLRRSVIHNDANDYNVIVSPSDAGGSRELRVAGLVDFGDMAYSYTVADVAIAIAYAVLDKPDPLRVAAEIVRGYGSEHALLDEELAQLWDLVRLRMCLSACMAAHQQPMRPDDEYLAVSQGPIRRTLPAVSRIHSRVAHRAFRLACGMSASPRTDRLVAWLQQAAPAMRGVPLVDGQDRAVALDLSVGSPLVSGDPRRNDEIHLTKRIVEVLAAAGASIGIGGYEEGRSLYTSPIFAGPTPTAEPRTVHLGIDVFALAGTVVRAPLAGVVHAAADNRAPLDYGPVVMLQHEAGDAGTFFTLYGHLTRDSLAALQPGCRINAGDALARLGTPDENGGWTPHLHFQVIVDPLDLDTDFPGVCRASEWPIWKALSPDPALLVPSIPSSADHVHPRSAETDELRHAHVGKNLSLAYRIPLRVARGWMQYLYDDRGRRFLDAYNNVPHVGHSHPRIAEVIARQAAILNTNTRYLHDNLARYAERLTATLPSPLRVCYFVNSGSEANELALRLARAHTRRHDVIVLDAAYHGNTNTLIDISPYKFNGPGGTGRKPWVHVVAIPDVFRGAFKRDDPDAGRKYADEVAEVTAALHRAGSGAAAFIAETCPSVGGQIVFPSGYLHQVYDHVRSSGGLCIADEVQTAYGRMGTSFYAFEDQHVVPDIVVLGKPIGNGFPLGAVITTAEVAASFANGMEFFSTFGGSTLSCAVGLEVLDIVQQERLQAHAAEVGAHLFAGLRSLAERHPIVGDVRGSGLFAGVELVSNRDPLEPAPADADYIVNRLREEGVLIGTDGPFHNVLKIRPPMPFDRTDADLLVSTLDRVLGEVDTRH